MAGHTEEGSRGGSSRNYVLRTVIPALPLRPMKKRTTSDSKVQEFVQGKNTIPNGPCERLKSGGWTTPEQDIRLQFGEVEGDHEQVIDSLENDFPASVSTTPLPSGMFAPRQLPDACNNDTSTQDASSRPSSASQNLKASSLGPSHPLQQALQKSTVELPADAMVSCFSSLNISFLYQEDPNSASQSSTLYSGSPIVTPRTASQEPTPPGKSTLELGSFDVSRHQYKRLS